MNKSLKIVYWIARIVAAFIMLQTLYFKFTASPESVYIFTKIGMEPWGRIAVGIMELIAASLLLINAVPWVGAMLGFGLMVGAIGMHLTILGIVVRNTDGTTDGGQLFIYAVIVTICCLFVLWVNKTRIASMWASIRQ